MTEMPDLPDPNIHVRAVRLFGWRAIVAIVAGMAALVAVAALLALSFLFIALPTMAIGAVAYYFLPKRPSRNLGNPKAADGTKNITIIEGNYNVTGDDAGKEENDRR